jgi:hypothetical protein
MGYEPIQMGNSVPSGAPLNYHVDLVLLLHFRSGHLRAERHQSGEEKCITRILVFSNKMRK